VLAVQAMAEGGMSRHLQVAEATLHSRRGAPSGRLAVTASALSGRRYVAPIVSEFVRSHPEVAPELLFVDRVVNLVRKASTRQCASATSATLRSWRFPSGGYGVWCARAPRICVRMARRVACRNCASTVASDSRALRRAPNGVSLEAEQGDVYQCGDL
jgi:hypothetical protein